jgi:hypothetical protein
VRAIIASRHARGVGWDYVVQESGPEPLKFADGFEHAFISSGDAPYLSSPFGFACEFQQPH